MSYDDKIVALMRVICAACGRPYDYGDDCYVDRLLGTWV